MSDSSSSNSSMKVGHYHHHHHYYHCTLFTCFTFLYPAHKRFFTAENVPTLFINECLSLLSVCTALSSSPLLSLYTVYMLYFSVYHPHKTFVYSWNALTLFINECPSLSAVLSSLYTFLHNCLYHIRFGFKTLAVKSLTISLLSKILFF